MRAQKTLIWGLGLLSIIGVAACSGGGVNSPTSPSASGAAGATITGTVQMAGAGPSAGQLAAHTSAAIEVCVNGTTVCTVINEEGKFTLSGPDVVGDVELVFRTLTGEILMTALLTNVGPDEFIDVFVDVSDRVFRVVTRVGGDDSSDDVSDDPSDGPSDDSSDDVSDEASDDASDDAPSEDDDRSGGSGPG